MYLFLIGTVLSVCLHIRSFFRGAVLGSAAGFMAAGAKPLVAIQPFVALGLLSANGNQPRRDKIRETASKFSSYQTTVALRFVLAAPEASTSSAVAAEQQLRRDLVQLNISDTPFRCGFKYVLWFAHAHGAFPAAQFLGAGDDDAYIQIAHFEADLRNVVAQVGEATPTLWGMIQWRSHYDKVTHDTSTGFMGWGCADGQAASVRRRMLACEAEVAPHPELRARLVGLLPSQTGSAAAASAEDTAVPPERARTKAARDIAPGLVARLQDAPACAALSANEKRLAAVLKQQVDWTLPPFPLPNGPLFAVSRPLGELVAAEIDTPAVGSRAWVGSLERTPLARRYWASTRPGAKPLPELAKRRCWPNSDSSLGEYLGWPL